MSNSDLIVSGNIHAANRLFGDESFHESFSSVKRKLVSCFAIDSPHGRSDICRRRYYVYLKTFGDDTIIDVETMSLTY